MPEKEMNDANALEIAKRCIVVGFNAHGQLNPDDTLSFWDVDNLESLKSWITGATNSEIGVTSILYQLNRDHLADMTGDWTIQQLATRIMDRSIPDMTAGRAVIVIVGSASRAGGAVNPDPNPDPSLLLHELGVDNPERLARFKQNIVQSGNVGVRRFKRVIDPGVLDVLTTESPIGRAIDILRTSSQPQF